MPIAQPEYHEIQEAAYYCHTHGGERHGHALKDWLQGEQLVFMANNYRVLGHHKLQSEIKEKLWSADPRICRYCGAVKPQNRGWREAHALPELIGNKTIIAMDECTACNDHFAQRVEDDFGKFLNLSKAVSRVPGKEGVPSFKTRSGKSRIDVDGDHYSIEQHAGNPFAAFDPATNTIALQAESPPFVPLAVFKCLTKMAIAIMPPQFLPKFEHTIRWLRNPRHADGAADIAASALCKMLFQPGPMRNDAGWCLLLGRRSPDAMIPDALFILTIANQSFQIMVPCSPGDNHWVGQKVPLPEYPAFYGFGYEFGEPYSRTLNLSSPDRQRITVSASMRSDHATKVT